MTRRQLHRLVRPRALCRACTLVSVGLTLALAPRNAMAQSIHYVSAELTVGSSYGYGGDPLSPDRNLGAFDAGVTLGARARFGGSRFGSWLVGINRAGVLSMGDDLECPVRIDSSGCIKKYPYFRATSLLVGWQTPNAKRGSIRVMAGPGAYSATYSGVIVPSSLGWQARAEIATPPLLHVSLVGLARFWVIPNGGGTRYRQRMIGFGLRVH